MFGREAALCNLLSTNEVPAAEEYPDQIFLPPNILDGSRAALAQTLKDNRERSVHFRHRNGSWIGGSALRGSNLKLKDNTPAAHANLLHVNSTMFYPPHIHLHTHPSYSEEMIKTMATRVLATEQDVSDELLISALSAFTIIGNLNAAVPSTADAYRSIRNPAASIGHLLASHMGNFMWVHRDIHLTKGVFENTLGRTYRKRWSEAEKVKRDIDDNPILVRYGVGETPDECKLLESALTQKASALSAVYVSYFSPDPNSQRLSKIGV